MSKISSTVRRTTKQGKMFPATVVDRGGGKASVRLSGTGALYRQLPLIGGQPSIGQNVFVDFNTDPPQVLSQTEIVIDETVNRTREKEIPRRGSVLEDNRMIRRYAMGVTLVQTYDADEVGMAQALADSDSSDLILLPPITLLMDFTVPQQITVAGDNRYTCIIVGTIDVTTDSKLNKLTVNPTSGSAPEEVYGVISYGNGIIDDCDIHACDCTSGSAGGIHVVNGTMIVRNSSVSGESSGGIGFASRVTTGSIRYYESQTYGSTVTYLDEDKTYVSGVSAGVAVCECPATTELGGSSFVLAGRTITCVYPDHGSGRTLGATPPSDLGSLFTDNDNSYGVGDATVVNDILYFVRSGGGLIERIILASPPMAYSDYDTDGANVKIVAVDETTVYVVFMRSTDNKFVIGKIDFSSTPAFTELDSWADEDTYNSDSKTLWTVPWIAHSKYNEESKIVVATSWLGNTGPEVVRILVFDVLTDQTVSFDWSTVYANDSIYLEVAAPIGSPSIWRNFVVFPVNVDVASYEQMDEEAFTYVVDTTDGSFTKLTVPRTYTWYNPAFISTTGVDRSTGVVYLYCYGYNDTSSAVLSVDLNDVSPTLTVDQTLSMYSGYIYQGLSSVYCVEDTGTQHRIKSIPGYSVLDTFANDDYITHIDDDLYAWQYDSATDKLKGYSLTGGADVNINITWKGATPYDYSSNRFIYPIMVYGGYWIVMVHSSQTGGFVQRELVILGAL